MRVDDTRGNEADIALEPGEVLHFSGRFLRGRSFGLTLIPPCPLGSPIARLLHGCYWLDSFHAPPEGAAVHLTGPSVVGRFQAVQVAAGEHLLLDAARLAAFSFASGGRLHTAVGQLLSPTMWALGHPLPVIASGPGTVVLYGEGLRLAEAQPGEEFIPTQVAACPATTPIAARALSPDARPLGHLANALGREARWVFPAGCRLAYLPVNRPEPHLGGMLRHLLIHLALIAAFFLLFHR